MNPKEAAVERVMEAWDRFYRRIAILHAPEIVELTLTLAQVKALYLVAASPEPLHLGSLAQQLRTALSTTSGVVDRLVQTGLVERTEDPADRRQVILRATREARRQLDAMSELGRDRMRQLLLRLPTTEDISDVERTIRLLIDAADGMNEEPAS